MGTQPGDRQVRLKPEHLIEQVTPLHNAAEMSTSNDLNAEHREIARVFVQGPARPFDGLNISA
jgi:hypothetical protein